LLLALVLLPLAAALAIAQESPESISDAEPPAREQTIYIPYSKLRQIFEKEGRGVFVPYDEFQKLWKSAREAARKARRDDGQCETANRSPG
jgi:hypothetical protein